MNLFRTEFTRFYLYNRRYLVNYISGIIAEYVYIFGLHLAISSAYQIPHLLFKLMMYWIFQSTVSNAVYAVESEIRTDYIVGILNQRLSLYHIYFGRAVVYILEGLVKAGVFALAMIFSGAARLSTGMAASQIPIYFAFFLGYLFINYYAAIALTLKFNRSATFISCYMMFLLFISGMVVDAAGVKRFFLSGRITSLVDGAADCANMPVTAILTALVGAVLFLYLRRKTLLLIDR